MSTYRDDLKHLQTPLIIAGLLLAAGAAGVLGMLKWTEQARLENVRIIATRNEAQGRLSRAREEEQEIKLNLQQYRQLAAKGIVGEENRLDWIERIAIIKSERRLFDIRYDIAEQKKVDASSTSGPEIMVSKMGVVLPLLHEDDLFNLLDDLRKGQGGYFQIKKCTISRNATPLDRRVVRPTLDASCEIEFYTIRERATTPPAGT